MKDKKKADFSISKLIFDVILSPVLVFLLVWFFTKDLRNGALAALFVITVLNLVSLILKFIKLILSSVTFNIFGVIKNSVQIVIALAVTSIYWIIYILIWGSNFGF